MLCSLECQTCSRCCMQAGRQAEEGCQAASTMSDKQSEPLMGGLRVCLLFFCLVHEGHRCHQIWSARALRVYITCCNNEHYQKNGAEVLNATCPQRLPIIPPKPEMQYLKIGASACPDA